MNNFLVIDIVNEYSLRALIIIDYSLIKPLNEYSLTFSVFITNIY